MYLIELIVKTFFKKKQIADTYNPLLYTDNENDYSSCEHIFMPLDSSGETLACTLCGKIVNKKDIERKNIFQE